MKLRALMTIVLLLLIIAWLALFFSSRAVLVYSEGPVQKSDQPVAVLECTYFTGTSLLKKEYWHSPNGPLGEIFNGVLTYSVCPRLLKL